MNLNTFARHNVLTDSKIVTALATKLADPEQVKAFQDFPISVVHCLLERGLHDSC